MKRVIWKWKIPVDSMGEFTLEIPEGALFLECQVQNGPPVVWAIVKPSAVKRTFNCRVIGTGHSFELGYDWTYIGTFQLKGGAFIGHLFIQGATKL